MKPINVREFNSLGIQIGDGNIKQPNEHLGNKINVSVGTSAKYVQ